MQAGAASEIDLPQSAQMIKAMGLFDRSTQEIRRLSKYVANWMSEL
jgi:hypothetical protein